MMENYSAIKRNELSSHKNIGRKLKNAYYYMEEANFGGKIS